MNDSKTRTEHSCGCDLTGMTPPAVHIVDGHDDPRPVTVSEEAIEAAHAALLRATGSRSDKIRAALEAALPRLSTGQDLSEEAIEDAIHNRMSEYMSWRGEELADGGEWIECPVPELIRFIVKDLFAAQGEAEHILAVIETVKRTGGAVEVRGVRIEPCDERGQTDTTRRADLAARDLYDAGTEIEALRDELRKVVQLIPGCMSPEHLHVALEKLVAERDAALAVIERVREALKGPHPYPRDRRSQDHYAALIGRLHEIVRPDTDDERSKS
ncbi:hypothetical protein [uncultured Aeromicrobium sp.]|uniref:hypothetical protein n=1 Tax=uncultured Aeromicrobium sp. TaxID=337820 RepID=UPI0025FBF5AA|nr:hypothetical protein [uncultured Aeromicrobium sp.]